MTASAAAPTWAFGLGTPRTACSNGPCGAVSRTSTALGRQSQGRRADQAQLPTGNGVSVSVSDTVQKRAASCGSSADGIARTTLGLPRISPSRLGPMNCPPVAAGAVAAYSCGSAPAAADCANNTLPTPASVATMPVGPLDCRLVAA